MKLLVFGANSQLGRELTRLLGVTDIEFDTLDTDEVDILKPKEVVGAISRINPTQLINVSTYSNLQKAESDNDAARLCDLVNTEGVTTLARVCQQLAIPMIHHSSSYVFDGQKKEPYTEEDESNPVCRYGKSKWLGERTLREENPRHIILRTDWLFGEFLKRYFHMYIDACKQNSGTISIVDNRFSPTFAADAARVIIAMSRQLDCNAEVWGTYHYCALQPVNQDQFVMQILEAAAALDPDLAEKMTSMEIDLLDVKPPYIRNTSLNCDKIMATFGIKQRSRGEGIRSVLNNIYGVVEETDPPTQEASRTTQKKPGRKKVPARKKTSRKRPSEKASTQK